ncbi:glycoside hydrolase family 19 protein [Pseudomonas alliivorans]|nr:glycoside hydrolase family 19 protein [Pseudomonas alliivorans]
MLLLPAPALQTRVVLYRNGNHRGLMHGDSARFLKHHETKNSLVPQLGGSEYLSKYDTGKLAERLGNTPEADGDGSKYRGRGLIQITGRANYAECGEALGLDLIHHPELIEQPEHAAMPAAWYWGSRGLNSLADKGDFIQITRRINGGTNGLADRQALYEQALKVLA